MEKPGQRPKSPKLPLDLTLKIYIEWALDNNTESLLSTIYFHKALFMLINFAFCIIPPLFSITLVWIKSSQLESVKCAMKKSSARSVTYSTSLITLVLITDREVKKQLSAATQLTNVVESMSQESAKVSRVSIAANFTTIVQSAPNLGAALVIIVKLIVMVAVGITLLVPGVCSNVPSVTPMMITQVSKTAVSCDYHVTIMWSLFFHTVLILSSIILFSNINHLPVQSLLAGLSFLVSICYCSFLFPSSFHFTPQSILHMTYNIRRTF